MKKDYTIYNLIAYPKSGNGGYIGCYGLTEKEAMKEFTSKYYRREWHIEIECYEDKDIWKNLIDIKKNGKCTETSF